MNVVFANHDHPVRLRAFKGDQVLELLVYIWRLTPGGPAGVRPAGELRIQLTGVPPPLLRGPDFKTLLLGWHQPTGIFAGFDVARRPQVWGASPSVQIRFSAISDAQASGFGSYRRATAGEGEIAIAFAPDSFMEYVLQQSNLHEFAENVREAEALETAMRGQPVDLDRVLGEGRREAIRKVLERVGQGNFRLRVLTAYEYHCAMCEIQLDLVQAAHIVPVAADGDNQTRNGLALCYLHHEAYDRALIGVTPDYRISISPTAVQRLERLRRTSKLRGFRENLRDRIFLPVRERDYPDEDRLRRGLQLRGWN